MVGKIYVTGRMQTVLQSTFLEKKLTILMNRILLVPKGGHACQADFSRILNIVHCKDIIL